MATTINSVSPALLEKMNPQKGPDKEEGLNGQLDTAEAIQHRFLTLLMTQLQNQDPTKPVENAEITAQMAQLSTVTGISQLNAAMTNLLGSLESLRGMEATNLLNKRVVVPGNIMMLEKGAADFAMQLTAPASDVQVNIMNENEEVVHTMKLGGFSEGIASFTWDGLDDNGELAQDGRYFFEVVAKNSQTSVVARPLSVGVVNSVAPSGTEGAMLDIADMGTIQFKDVLKVLGLVDKK